MQPGPASISVVVFVRNAETTIERALSSVLDQKISDIEVMVFDGGSTDGTVDILRKYEQKIDYWRSGPDGGPTNAINEGVARASGDVICLLPGDDWFEPDSLRKVQEAFTADPGLELLSCGTRYVRFDDAGNMHVDQQFLSAEELEFSMDKVLAYPLTAGRIIRRRVYQRMGGHNGKFRFADYDFLVRVCLGGVRSGVLPFLTYTYRRHPGSTTFGNNPENILSMLRESMEMTALHASRAGISAENRKALLARNGRASAHYAWSSFRRGHWREMMSAVISAIRVNPYWPIYALGLLLFGSKSRGSIAAER